MLVGQGLLLMPMTIVVMMMSVLAMMVAMTMIVSVMMPMPMIMSRIEGMAVQEARIELQHAIKIEGALVENLIQRNAAAHRVMDRGEGIEAANTRLDLLHLLGRD